MILDPVFEARVDLAAALRWAARLGLHEGVCNHFSLLVPGTTDRFLLNAHGLHWSEATASGLCVVDLDGNPLEGSNPPEPTAFFIHSRVHQANPRAACVLHTHMPYATALTLLETPRLEMLHQNALRFFGQVAYDEDYNGLALDTAEGDRIAAAMADKRVGFLANHGVLVTGPTVADAFDDLFYLERACQLQVLAYSTGRPLKPVRQDVAAATFAQFERERVNAHHHFRALKRILDREEPEYRC